MQTAKKICQEAIVSLSSDGKINLHCSNCHVVIKTGGVYEDRVHYCALCMSEKCSTKYKEN